MIDLLITIFTGGGAVGLGSIFKIISGWFDSRAHLAELKEARKAKNEEIFIKSQDNNYTRFTRRLLALIGVSTLAIITIHCTLFPGETLITLHSVASGGDHQSWSLLWGFIEIPRSDKEISLTTGHIAILNSTAFCMILGYYFTPGGRK